MEREEKLKKCRFCTIGRGEKEEKILYETEDLVAFPDNSPRTPTHVLIMPRRHYDGFADMMTKEPELLPKIGEAVEVLVEQLGLKGKWYTWGFHCGGKESVSHVHAQLLAGMTGDELVL